jgi:hypothetical protein
LLGFLFISGLLVTDWVAITVLHFCLKDLTAAIWNMLMATHATFGEQQHKIKQNWPILKSTNLEKNAKCHS